MTHRVPPKGDIGMPLADPYGKKLRSSLWENALGKTGGLQCCILPPRIACMPAGRGWTHLINIFAKY